MADQQSDHDGFTELSQFELHAPSIRLLGYNYCLQNNVVVLGAVDPAGDQPVTVGMVDPQEALVAELSTFLSRVVRPVRLNRYEVRKALAIGFDREAEDRFKLALAAVQDLSFKPETAIVDMLNEVFGKAVHLGASDIHIERYEDDVDVRLRIDGLLQQVGTPFSVENIRGLISRLKILAHLDISERRVAQDGRIRAVFEHDGDKRGIDFRVSIVPGPFGEDAVLRILDSTTPIIGLPALGMQPEVLAAVERMAANPEGLILVTGPTGSGKTTTLYSMLDRLRSTSRKVLTVEDPIEYNLGKTNQKQVTEQMSFADYARAFMRQNPDVILIGEIRDEETADVAMRAAQTGHLVLSTLHTNDAARAVSRLHTLGVEPTVVAESLLGAISQRLLRRLCTACREERAAEEETRARLRLLPGERFFAPRGCDACRGTGYRGRVGVYELLIVDGELADRVASGEPIHRLRARALEKGMVTLLDDALRKARAGVTSLAEVLRVMPYRIIEAQREVRD